jgi:outer membrane biosynthesis protein TonB
MDVSERASVGIAVAGHVVLFALLSASFVASRDNPLKIESKPIDVSLVQEVGLEAQAPATTEAPAQSVAPEIGPPEDSAPAAEIEIAPDPAPPKPQPAPAPPPKPAAVSKPQPVKPTPPAPAKAAAPAKPAAAKPKPVQVASKTAGTNVAATNPRPRGGRLGADFLKGIVAEPSAGKAQTPPAAKIDARALAGLQAAISRQIQPCADRQVDPGPGANQITTVLNLRLNRDGTLAGTPTMVRQAGVNDENSRYARRVVDLGVAAFKGCSPLQLPAEFYQTAAGGWSNLNYVWKLR